MPFSTPNGGPYVITTGIEVGEIAYAATYAAWFMAVVIWAGVRLLRRAGLPPTAALVLQQQAVMLSGVAA
jgi:hypothetical protein